MADEGEAEATFSYKFDPKAGASYLTVTTAAVGRTVDLGGGVIVDLDANGAVVGFEDLNGRMSFPTAARVIRALRWPISPSGLSQEEA